MRGRPFAGCLGAAPSIPERIATDRPLLRCWEPSDGPALRVAIDSSLDHLRQWLPWALGRAV